LGLIKVILILFESLHLIEPKIVSEFFNMISGLFN